MSIAPSHVNPSAVQRDHVSKQDYMQPAPGASETVSRCPRTSRRSHITSGKQATPQGISASGTSIVVAPGPGPVPEEHRGGYDYWLASNVLEFTSDAYQTTLYDNDNKPVDLPGYRVDALTDAVIRYVDRHKTEPFYLFTSYLEPHHQNHLDDYPPPDGYRERYTGKWIPPESRGTRWFNTPTF